MYNYISINLTTITPVISFLKSLLGSVPGDILAGVLLATLFFLIRDCVNKKNNLSGKWIMYEKVMSSDYGKFLGMRLISTVNILHTEKNISGHGEKRTEITLDEGEKNYYGNDRTKYIIEGHFEWRFIGKNVLRFLYQLKSGSGKRDISTYLTVKQLNNKRLEGWFMSEAGNSSGTVVLIKDDFMEFEKGALFLLIKRISKIINVRLVDNIEHVFIKAFVRSKQIKGKYSNLKNTLILIEDKRFYEHNGVDIKSFLRGILSRFSYFRKRFNLLKSGGSTISMQLARTLFIKDYSKVTKRKVLEVLIAIYLEKRLNKEQILDMYIASVRFRLHTYGLMNAMISFFGGFKNDLDIEECFFLIERLSAVNNTYSFERVMILIASVKKEGFSLDVNKVINLYKCMGIKELI